MADNALPNISDGELPETTEVACPMLADAIPVAKPGWLVAIGALTTLLLHLSFLTFIATGAQVAGTHPDYKGQNLASIIRAERIQSESKPVEQPANSVPTKDQKPDVIYVSTPQKVVDAMLDLVAIKPGDVLFDLGSGDGRIPISAAQQHKIRAIGYEIDPALVKTSQAASKKKGVENLATFEQRDIFKLDLSQANVVTLYLLPSLNERLIPQLDKMKPGSRIVSHDFDIEGVIPDKIVRMNVPTTMAKCATTCCTCSRSR